ncbi:MAG: Fe-S cluster assembly protein SufD [Rhodanobacter sp.]
MNQPARTPFVASLLDAPLPDSGIGWLDDARRENLEAFATAGLPDTRVEAWKYTALRALAQRSFVAGDAQAATRVVDAAALTLPGIDGPRLVFVNGVFRADLSQLSDLPIGLSLQPLSQALRQDAEPLRFALARHYREAGDVFARLNAAFAGDGVVLRVAAGAKIAEPVQLVFVGVLAEGAAPAHPAPAALAHPCASDIAWHARNVIELGEGAELSLIEHHVASDEQNHLGTLVSDLVLRDDAKLQYTLLQNAAEGSSLIRRSSLHLGARAHAAWHVLELGGALVRHDLQAELLGNEARLDTSGVFALHGRQHVDTQLAIRHQALNTTSASNWRGVADQRARGVFRGAIVVAPGADGSDASLSNKNLLLSAQAEIDTKPELEIYADEVKAAHGATVGQLDERALFYLRSRGIPLSQARALLTAAFCRAVLQDVPHEALREHLSSLLMARLPADSAT